MLSSLDDTPPMPGICDVVYGARLKIWPRRCCRILVRVQGGRGGKVWVCVCRDTLLTGVMSLPLLQDSPALGLPLSLTPSLSPLTVIMHDVARIISYFHWVILSSVSLSLLHTLYQPFFLFFSSPPMHNHCTGRL